MQTFSILFEFGVSRMPWQRRLHDAVRRASDYGRDCADCCRQGHAAAQLYDELSRLSPSELRRRGIRDGDLHRHIRDRLG
jgi:hypothetical protein